MFKCHLFHDEKIAEFYQVSSTEYCLLKKCHFFNRAKCCHGGVGILIEEKLAQIFYAFF